MQAAARRPDIVFFMLDQLSAKRLEGHARAAVPPPNIDRRETERAKLRDLLLEHVILQDYPQPPRDLYALGVH